MGALDGRVAVVTGGSSGIGRATVLALAAEGVDVAIIGRNATALDDVASQVRAAGRRAMPGVVDVRDEAQVTNFLDDVVADSDGSTLWSTTPASAIPAASSTVRSMPGARSSTRTCWRC